MMLVGGGLEGFYYTLWRGVKCPALTIVAASLSAGLIFIHG